VRLKRRPKFGTGQNEQNTLVLRFGGLFYASSGLIYTLSFSEKQWAARFLCLTVGKSEVVVNVERMEIPRL
jgi:hypothetical protein